MRESCYSAVRLGSDVVYYLITRSVVLYSKPHRNLALATGHYATPMPLARGEEVLPLLDSGLFSLYFSHDSENSSLTAIAVACCYPTSQVEQGRLLHRKAATKRGVGWRANPTERSF